MYPSNLAMSGIDAKQQSCRSQDPERSRDATTPNCVQELLICRRLSPSPQGAVDLQAHPWQRVFILTGCALHLLHQQGGSLGSRNPSDLMSHPEVFPC